MRCFVLILGLLLTFQVKAAQIGSFLAGEGSWQVGSLTLGNLDNDAALEIVLPYRNNLGLWFMDAFNPDGSRCVGFPYAGGLDPINAAATLVDLNGDGKDDLVFTHGNRVVALNGATGVALWISPVTSANYV